MTSRRTFIKNGCLIAAVFTVTGAAGAELVSRGVLPGRAELERLDGACSVPAPPVPHGPPGPALSGTFRSAARRRPVGYTIAYPPGHRPGDELPLVIMLHGYGGNHADALAGMSGRWPGSCPRVPWCRSARGATMARSSPRSSRRRSPSWPPACPRELRSGASIGAPSLAHPASSSAPYQGAIAD